MAEDNFVHKKRAGKKAKGYLKLYGYNNNTSKAEQISLQKREEEKAKGNFGFDSIHGFKLVEKEYKTPKKKRREETRAEFKQVVRPAFLKFIAENYEPELRKLGVTDAGLASMKRGMGVNGFNVHHKLPIHGGGTNDFSNLIFMPIPPHDDLHHQVIDPQIKNMDTRMGVTIKVPWHDGMVWERPSQSREHIQLKPVQMAARIKQKASGR